MHVSYKTIWLEQSVYNTHSCAALAAALLDLLGLLNSPQQDDILLREAGVSIDRALFPLLVRIGAADSLSVVELADKVGRDHSTISRQTAKLETLGLISRRQGVRDQRVREAAITNAGKRAVQAITAARKRLLSKLLADWSPEDRESLARLNQKLADAMKDARRREEPIVHNS
jgi:DNA-binding MarR family transcriptional regulator